MSQEVNITIKATDEASRTVAAAGKNVESSLKGVEQAGKDVAVSNREVEASGQRVAASLSESERAQIANAQTTMQLKDAQETLKTKQQELNAAIRDYGAESEQAATKLRELNAAQADVNSLQGQLSTSTKQATVNMKGMVVGMSGVATSAFSLYNAYDRVNTAQLSLDRANLKVKSSANSLEDAQRRQNRAADALEQSQKDLAKAIEETGEDSEDTAKAQAKLQKATEDYEAAISDATIAQERYKVNVDAAEQSQKNMTNAIIATGLQIIPTTITIVDSFAKIQAAAATAAGVQGVGGLSAALTSLKSIGAIVLPVTVTIGVVWAIQKGIEWVKEQIIYPSAPGLKGYEQLTPSPLKGVQVPGMQAGGIVTQPTLAWLGEAGPEAVIPLDRMASQPVVHVHFHGDVYGIDDFERRVVELASEGVMEQTRRRG